MSSTYTSIAFSEDFVDHLLESGSGILQAKGHNLVAVDGLVGGEGCLVLVLWMHLDLVTSRVSIHEAEKFVAAVASTI